MTSCSLLIPCHNAAKYLPRLWETVKAQTVTFDEIICYDDGSTDNTADVARSLGAKVILGGECKGVSHARNQLAKASSCSWFHFHDADDILHAKYLEKVKAKINEITDIIICDVDWIDEKTRELVISWKYKDQDFKINTLTSAISKPIGGINGLYRKETFFSVGGFDESYSCWEDADLHVRLAATGARFAMIEEVLSFSLRSSGSLSDDQYKCLNCRFNFLKTYSKNFDSSVSEVIIEQLEIVARSFLIFKDRRLAFEAIKFCEYIGGNPPQTNNRLLKLSKSILPAFWILLFQHFVRNRSR